MANVVDQARARPRSLSHRAAIRADYLAATGHDRMHGRQLDHMEEAEDYIMPTALRGNVRATDDPSMLLLHRTWRQLSRGVGWADKGMTVNQVHVRFKTQWHRTLDYLVVAGRIQSWAPIYEGRESTGILIRLPAGVAQSVGASRYRPAFERRPSCSQTPPRGPSGVRVPVGDPGPVQPFLSRETDTPPKGLGGSSSVSFNPGERRGGCARARAPRPVDVRAALDGERCTLDEGGGAAVVRALPWLAEVAPAVLAREACRVWWPQLDLRLSAKWRAHLETAVEQLDRLEGRGGGAAMVLDLAGAESGRPDPLLLDLLMGDPQKPRRDKKPRTLGAIAVGMRRWARRQVAYTRRRKAAAG